MTAHGCAARYYQHPDHIDHHDRILGPVHHRVREAPNRDAREHGEDIEKRAGVLRKAILDSHPRGPCNDTSYFA